MMMMKSHFLKRCSLSERLKKNKKKEGNASTTTYVKLIVEKKMEKTPFLALKLITFLTSYDVAISGNPISNYFFA